MTRVCVTRLGAIGDMVQMSPVLRLLKEKGYHVTCNTKKVGLEVLRHNPYVDDYIVHDDNIPHGELNAHWDEMAKDFDLYINLNGVIENGLLPAWYDEHYKWEKDKRHERCDKNYVDAMLEKAGLDERGLNGELYFSAIEKSFARKIRKKYSKDKFLIIWSLSGSSFHKTWPWAEDAAKAFLEVHQDVVIITVGDDACLLLEWEHERTINKSGLWTVRKSLAMTQEANLVVGTETGILNAAGAFDTPKVALLSHSTEENLTKYWNNCASVTPPDTPCYPCHKLHYSKSTCTLHEESKTPACAMNMRPAKVLNAMEDYYNEWRSGNGRHTT